MLHSALKTMKENILFGHQTLRVTFEKHLYSNRGGNRGAVAFLPIILQPWEEPDALNIYKVILQNL